MAIKIPAEEIQGFVNKITSEVPGLLNADVEIQPHRDFTEIILTLRKQKMIDNFLDDLESSLQMFVLYVLREKHEQYYEAVAYSKPYAGNMFLVILNSHQYGIISQVNFLVFPSFELMYETVEVYVNKVRERRQETIVEQEDINETFTHLMK